MFVALFVFLNLLTPLSVLAADETSTNQNATGAQGIDKNSTTNPNAEGGTGDLAQNVLTIAGTCSIGAILGRLISSTIGGAIQALASYLSGFITSIAKRLGVEFITEKATVVATGPMVPVNSPRINDANKLSIAEQRQLTAKETGTANTDEISLLGGFLTGLTNISLDSIMFCVVNEIMNYITEATIQWINTGFKGNPVFVQNPGALMKGIADQEASNFVYSLSGGVQQAVNQGIYSAADSLAAGVSNGAIQIFEPIKQQVVMDTVSGYNGADDLSRQLQCPMTEEQYNELGSGRQWTSGNYDALMMAGDPRCNTYGARTFITNPYLQRKTAEAQENMRYNTTVSGGYLPNTKCADGRVREYDGSCDPRYLQNTIPLKAVSDELQARGMMKYMRVSFANDFDSIVTALVNQLIKIAVNKIYESADGASESSQSSGGGGGASGRTGGR